MRQVISVIFLTLLMVPVISCGDLKKMMGGGEKEEKLQQTERKLKEIEEKMKQMQTQAQAQARSEAATPPPEAAEKPSRSSGYVRLYDDAGFTDRILTVPFGRDIGNMHYVKSNDGKDGFNDKASSVKYSVPPGWQAILYENNNYAKRGYALKGSGSIPDLGYFGDKCSSIRWERASE